MLSLRKCPALQRQTCSSGTDEKRASQKRPNRVPLRSRRSQPAGTASSPGDVSPEKDRRKIDPKKISPSRTQTDGNGAVGQSGTDSSATSASSELASKSASKTGQAMGLHLSVVHNLLMVICRFWRHQGSPAEACWLRRIRRVVSLSPDEC